jgi:sec-independent protein translocase protein TatB
MFDVGFAELFLLALIGLLVLGPERLPAVARTLGGFVRKAWMRWICLRYTIEAEMAEADLSKPIKQTSDELKQIAKDLSESSVIKPEKPKAEKPEADSTPADETKPEPQQQTESRKPDNV